MPSGDGKVVVAVAGGFDPFHDGHLDYFQKASKLGEYLIVMASNDEDMVRKKGKCCLPLSLRIQILKTILRWMDCEGIVVPTVDRDGTMAETLRRYKPDIFAKGGDRTPDNMPQSEVSVCNEIGCKIVYGVGDLLHSSTQIMRERRE